MPFALSSARTLRKRRALGSESERTAGSTGLTTSADRTDIDPANEAARRSLLDRFAPLFAGSGGIDSWLGTTTPQAVVERLGRLSGADPLSREQLNQLLVLSHEAEMSRGFFRYYWLHTPEHPYNITELPDFDSNYSGEAAIASIAHLRWGLTRFYLDALLYFGNVRSAYRYLREMAFEELVAFFAPYRVDTDALERRGPALPLSDIIRDDRYLISEMACKSLAATSGPSQLGEVLKSAYQRRVQAGKTASVSVRQLLDDAPAAEKTQLTFAADDLLADELTSLAELDARIAQVVAKFDVARSAALENTKLYLSMVGDLDVYVATSMRNREDFREMANFCDAAFTDAKLAALNLRYFDPTMSAADGHEDKGLIECLMVKSARVLIYSAGAKESFGKDAEAAMALTQGKPVILYCPDKDRQAFYRDVHPLARLIDFRTGVANGWMVAGSSAEVVELLSRILRNEMAYELEQSKPGYLRLKEGLTHSIVRLQTSDTFLRETFWNHYHRERLSPVK
jgi:hypothetical protein